MNIFAAWTPFDNSSGKDGKQKIDKPLPGLFVKDTIYEEISNEYSAIMLMLLI